MVVDNRFFAAYHMVVQSQFWASNRVLVFLGPRTKCIWVWRLDDLPPLWGRRESVGVHMNDHNRRFGQSGCIHAMAMVLRA
jgi:hypothetical protein